MFNSNYHLSTLTWQPIVISVNTYELHMPIFLDSYSMQLSPASGSPHHPEQHLSSSMMFTSSLFRTYTIVGSSYEGHLFEEEELYSDPRTTLFLISMSISTRRAIFR